MTHTPEKIAEEIIRPDYEQLQAGLNLAVAMLAPYEPPDSRAVSDEFVALAALSVGHADKRVMDVIRSALSSHGGNE